MAEENKIQLFEGEQIRYVWDEEQEKYFFSVVDVIQVLTDSVDGRKYWNKLKQRLKEEGNETVTNCHQLKFPAADGKMRLTDVADTEQVFRLIQSIPSKKAEPFKLWLASLGQERMNQLQDPELSIEQAIKDYRRLGYSEDWINQRIKTIEIRKGLTDEWQRGGMKEDHDYAILTDIISRAWSGMTTREYKKYKGLRKESLRDNMTNVELMLNGLAEAAATELSKRENPKGFVQNANVAQRGGDVAHVARERLEHELGDTVISDRRAVNFTNPPDELPFNDAEETNDSEN
ncbi:MAG: Bro-N domain-containing protein [Paludibacteraceae bacterium]|nr:Bro-N domain-containing protein [Paludibacteraceae bacterium]